MPDVGKPCPSCGQTAPGVVRHCPSPTCQWVRCGAGKCQAVIDPKRLRGYALDPDSPKGATRALLLRGDDS